MVFKPNCSKPFYIYCHKLYFFSPDSQQNIAIFQQLVNELFLEYGGQEKCPWTHIQMKGIDINYIYG